MDATDDIPQTDYRRFFDLSLDLLCVAGLDGYFKRVSPSWTRVMGWSEAELLARPVADFMHPEDRQRTLAARAGLARGIPVRGLENRYLCKDGSYRWLSWQSSVELPSQRVYAVARDVTERRYREQERLVVSKVEAAGRLAAGVAHDFNNLHATVLLSLDMIETNSAVNDVQTSFLRQARQAVLSARALTQRLIAFAEAEVPERLPAELGRLLPDACAHALQGSSLAVEYAIAPDLWLVNLDALQMTQVFSSFVMNARESSPRSGAIRVEAANVVVPPNDPARAPGEYVRVRIIDDGVGIPEDVLPKVFEPYFSTKQRGTRKGMGLGLTICRAAVQRHGGTVEIESQAGRGTVVICHLPALPIRDLAPTPVANVAT